MKLKCTIRFLFVCGILFCLTSCLWKNNNYSCYDPHTNIKNTTNDGHLIRRAIKRESRHINKSLRNYFKTELIHDTILVIDLEKVIGSPIDSFFCGGGFYESYYQMMNYPPRRGGVLDYYMYRMSFFYNGQIIYEENFRERKYPPFFSLVNGKENGPYFSKNLYVRRRHYNQASSPKIYLCISDKKGNLTRKLFIDEHDSLE